MFNINRRLAKLEGLVTPSLPPLTATERAWRATLTPDELGIVASAEAQLGTRVDEADWLAADEELSAWHRTFAIDDNY